MADPKRVYAPLRVRTLWLKIFLCIWLGLNATLTLLRLSALLAVYAPNSGLGSFVVSQNLDRVILGFTGLDLIGCAIAFCFWIYRANSNLHAMGDFAIHGPAWAVGGYFIPFANLFYGYEAMRDIWNNSGPPDNNLEGWGWLVPIWWGSWVLSNGTSYILGSMGYPSGTDVRAVQFGEALLYVIAGVALMVIISKIDKAQEQQDLSAVF